MEWHFYWKLAQQPPSAASSPLWVVRGKGMEIRRVEIQGMEIKGMEVKGREIKRKCTLPNAFTHTRSNHVFSIHLHLFKDTF